MDGGTLQTIPVSVRRGTASDDSGASADRAGASCRQLGSPLCRASGNANEGVAAGQLHHSGGMHSQTIPDKKPESTASATAPVCLRFNSGPYDPPSRRCQASHACGAVPETSCQGLSSQSLKGTLRPTPPFSVASIKRPRMPWDPPASAAQAKDMLLRTRAKVPASPHKAGLVPAFFAPVPRWCDRLLGPALPKPHPMLRPPPRSLRFCPPCTPAHRQQRVPVSFSVQDLPATKARQDKKPRLGFGPRASAPAPPGPILREHQESARKAACALQWRQLLEILGPESSSLQMHLLSSKHPEALADKSLSPFTAGTVERYLSSVRQFIDYLAFHCIELGALTTAQLADFLHACEQGLQEDREICRLDPKSALKALSWVSRNAGLSTLAAILQDSLIAAFRSQKVADRREALPLPLAVVVAWERRLCEADCPADLCILLGGFLLALHGGLRFGDLQRIRLTSLSLTSSSLRGVCWQTKTTRQGQPFAVTLTGLSGRSVQSLWVLPFLRAVQAAWIRTETAYLQPLNPDFILPTLTNLGGSSSEDSAYHRPMSYSQALSAMRFAMGVPWQHSSRPAPVSPEEALAFTLHSLKVCLLSAGAQVRAAEQARQHQGHHKSPSVQLYSRDDTILALDLQAHIAQACAEGWRPTRPIARGGQPPTLEPPFEVPRSTPPSRFPLDSFGVGLSRFIYSREAEMEQASRLQAEDEVQPIGVDPGQAASASPPIPDDDYEALLVARFAAEHDSSSESDQPTEAKPSEPIAFSLFRNGPWGCIHACIEASDKAACGAARSAAAFSPTDPDPTFFCRRKACAKLLDSWE